MVQLMTILSIIAILGLSLVEQSCAENNVNQKDFTVETQQQNVQNVLFILDNSTAMNEKVDSKHTQMDVAKEFLIKICSKLPAGTKCGLKIYGIRPSSGSREKTLLVPLSESKDAIKKTLKELPQQGIVAESNLTQTVAFVLERDLTNVEGKSVLVLLPNGFKDEHHSLSQYIKSRAALGPIPELFFVNLHSPSSGMRTQLLERSDFMRKYDVPSQLRELANLTHGAYLGIDDFALLEKRLKSEVER
jgi:hypothetical protein